MSGNNQLKFIKIADNKEQESNDCRTPEVEIAELLAKLQMLAIDKVAIIIQMCV